LYENAGQTGYNWQAAPDAGTLLNLTTIAMVGEKLCGGINKSGFYTHAYARQQRRRKATTFSYPSLP
jgi:hypothetical protein